MRISDWSSDGCSSDLLPLRRHRHGTARLQARTQLCDSAAQRRDCTLSRAIRQRSAKAAMAAEGRQRRNDPGGRSEEHTSELQSLMRISYAVFCLKKKNKITQAADTIHKSKQVISIES